MTVDAIILHIERIILEQQLSSQTANFHADAHLIDELFLDSVLIMRLLLTLETEYDVAIPDEVLTARDISTVRHLARLVNRTLTPSNASQEDGATDEINVHCVVSCLCDAITQCSGIDHRPFYFSVPDAEIYIDSQYRLDYHDSKATHAFFTDWFYRLYGVHVRSWYRHNQSKQANISLMQSLLDAKSESQRVMVMVDMYRLPQRENKYNRDPFPHFIMLENTDNSDDWLVRDPDFRYEGVLPKQDIVSAIESPHVSGGFVFDVRQLRAPKKGDIKRYFEVSISLNRNGLTEAIRHIVSYHLQQQSCTKTWLEAVRSIPVLAIRKYAYEHALAFFMLDALLSPASFETWCDTIAELVNQFTVIQYTVMKIAQSDGAIRQSHCATLEALLQQQDQREFAIKKQLQTLFFTWSEKYASELQPSQRQEEIS